MQARPNSKKLGELCFFVFGLFFTKRVALKFLFSMDLICTGHISNLSMFSLYITGGDL
jgi:hypothetical protein